jgi:SAM-dependent methyltransferase
MSDAHDPAMLRLPATEGAGDFSVDARDEGARASPNRILEVGYAFWRAKALLSAVELGVFTILAEGALDLEALTRRVGVHARGARDFFDALVALEMLHRDAQGRYRNAPDCDRYLDRRKPSYLGDLLAHLNARHYHNWGALTQALRSGAPRSDGVGDYKALHDGDPMQAVFLNGMTAGSLLAAQALAAKFPWDGVRTVIDVGCAQGGAVAEIARAHSHLTGGGFDLPPVESAFSRYVEDNGLSDRLQFYAGDFFTDALPSADALVMGRILHNWDLATKKMLLKKAHLALPPGGVLIVYDPMIDDDRRANAHALLSSLNMLIETADGFEYTGSECAEWMTQAGFTQVHAEPLGDVHTAIVAKKSR